MSLVAAFAAAVLGIAAAPGCLMEEPRPEQVPITNDTAATVVVTVPDAGGTAGRTVTLAPGEAFGMPPVEGTTCARGTFRFATSRGTVFATRDDVCSTNPVSLRALLATYCASHPTVPDCKTP